MILAEQNRRPRLLIRDTKFTAGLDEVFRSEGIRVIRAPFAAPQAKAHAERSGGSVRRECLDRIVILSRTHLLRTGDRAERCARSGDPVRQHPAE